MARTMGCNSNSNSNVLDAGRTSNNNRMLNAVRDQNILLNTIITPFRKCINVMVEKMMLLFGVLRPGCVFRYFFPELWSM